MGAYCVTRLNMTAEQANSKFKPYAPLFRHYRDPLKTESFYDCTLLHCLKGLELAIKYKWYDHQNFKRSEYELYNSSKNDNLNWIIPGKVLAMPSPIDCETKTSHHPQKYATIFKKLGVSRVIQLNSSEYDPNTFTDVGIAHDQIYLADGSCPPEDCVNKFLTIMSDCLNECGGGAVAVHCKAGLGRTGMMIGLWAMKHYQMPAEAFIGWARIARPGSVCGPQQLYLVSVQYRFIKNRETILRS